MTDLHSTEHHSHDDVHTKVVFGFWTFVLSDCVLFAALFATYAVLHNNVWDNIGIAQVASLPFVLMQSLVLLTCSFTYGLSFTGFHNGNKGQVLFWLLITLLLGIVFISLEYHEFAILLQNGHSWQNSAFLSIFFTLVGTHGFHVIAALIWTLILLIQIGHQGLTSTMKTRMTCLGVFIHFLNLIWIFIFTIVYLMGAL